MLMYLLKSAACLAILLLFYKIFLEKQRMHTFKRFYLMGALVLSLVIPSVVFIEYVTVPILEEVAPLNSIETGEILETQDPLEAPFDFTLLIWPIYFIGLSLFGFKFIQNLAQIIKRIRNNPKQKLEQCTHVLIQEKMPPHTFWKFIFLNRRQWESNDIPYEVMAHEEAHVKERHSLDVIFIELLQVLLWFNPLIILFKRAIKLNHEFLADQAVLSKNVDTVTYQYTLLAYSNCNNDFHSALSNAINYSSIKKRLTVMKTRTSKKSILIRSFLLLPLLSLLLYGFSDKKTIARASKPLTAIYKDYPIKIKINTKQEIFVDGEKIKLENISTELNRIIASYGSINSTKSEVHLEAEGHLNIQLLTLIKKQVLKTEASLTMIMADSIIMSEKDLDETFEGTQFTAKDTLHIKLDDGNTVKGTSSQKQQQSATREQMAEYNKLAKHYNNMPRNKMRILLSDVERLTYIYNLMSEKQRQDAEPFPDFPDPPAPPKAPSNKVAPPSPPSKHNVVEVPPPPPPGSHIMEAPVPPVPPTPLDHVKKMAAKGAVFYYEGKQISAEKAIKLVKNNKSLNIDSRGDTKSGKPTVKISKDPIIIER
ncbi:M56 family metallopeptidase [Flagellimonas sp.]|uniref:M56 family metallopeptidase n=1 Tax=Flagellimonas sp. TaxID=2058762 RepID=UPI003B5095D3